ncbi:ssDNA-binding protein [Microbulbifer sp. 2201CG32-9]|uniref:ssDNA-binding protein n=1 Tax=Microbulbifer sp. 2201CG32-9 TaxID=3232309 RepID=UPI00345B792C
MASKKPRYPTTTTPVVSLIFPRLFEPDTKYVKPDGEYHTKFALEAGKGFDEFVAKLEEVRDGYIKENPDDIKPAKLKKAKMADFYEEECDHEGEETGRMIFRAKLKAVVKTKTKSWKQKPFLFDAKANPIQEEISVWSGSTAKLSLELFPYFMESTKEVGVSLRLKAVQIIELVQGGGDRDAGSYSFGEEEGYESPASEKGFTDETDSSADEGEEEEF